jgi:hypothetical protein
MFQPLSEAEPLSAEEFNKRELQIQWTNPIMPEEIYQFAEAYTYALRTQLAEAQRERDEWKAEHSTTYAFYLDEVRQLNRVRLHLERAERALREYGEHKETCGVWAIPYGDCTCGLGSWMEPEFKPRPELVKVFNENN